jgi:hypothetical protein
MIARTAAWPAPRSEAILCASCSTNLTHHATHIAQWDGTRNQYYCRHCDPRTGAAS